jgi:hypothetical protein
MAGARYRRPSQRNEQENDIDFMPVDLDAHHPSGMTAPKGGQTLGTVGSQYFVFPSEVQEFLQFGKPGWDLV